MQNSEMQRRRTILLVEDEPSITEPLAEALGREGFDTQVAGTVATADPGLFTLAEHRRHETHALALRPSPVLRIWSLIFAAGTP